MKLSPNTYTPEMPSTDAREYCVRMMNRMRCFCDEEIEDCMHALTTLQKTLHMSTSTTQFSFSIFGFAKFARRNMLLRVLRKILRPRLLYCSNTKPQQFEGYMLLRGCSDLPAALEQFVVHLKHNMLIMEMENTMNLQTIACLDRVSAGTRVFGNWYISRNHVVRLQYSLLKRNIAERDETQRVLESTGMHYSSTNMIALHTAYDSASTHLARLQSTKIETQRQLAYVAALSKDLLHYIDNMPHINVCCAVTSANAESMLRDLGERIDRVSALISAA